MEIKTLDNAKQQMMLGNSIKFMMTEGKPENFDKVDILGGKVTKINAQWEYTPFGDKCVSFQFQVDVIDPKDGGTHHLKTDRAYTSDTPDADIKFSVTNDEIARLQKQIRGLEDSKI